MTTFNQTMLPGDTMNVVVPASAPAPPPILPIYNIPTVAIINETSPGVLSDAELDRYAKAYQIQCDRDLSLYWGLTNKIVRATRATAPVGSRWLVFLDTTDQAGALGYHDLTATGQPLGKVFVKTDLQYGLKPSITGSHELLEMACDPRIADGVFYGAGSTGYWLAKEVCDPCEADNYGYLITLPDGTTVWVSDFVTPSWYQPGIPGPWDFGKYCTGALQLLKGGYASYMPVANPSWKQSTASHNSSRISAAMFGTPSLDYPRSVAMPVGSRRERRRRGEEHWLRSRGAYA